MCTWRSPVPCGRSAPQPYRAARAGQWRIRRRRTKGASLLCGLTGGLRGSGEGIRPTAPTSSAAIPSVPAPVPVGRQQADRRLSRCARGKMQRPACPSDDERYMPELIVSDPNLPQPVCNPPAQLLFELPSVPGDSGGLAGQQGRRGKLAGIPSLAEGPALEGRPAGGVGQVPGFGGAVGAGLPPARLATMCGALVSDAARGVPPTRRCTSDVNSPGPGRVGLRIGSFGAGSVFTRVPACQLADGLTPPLVWQASATSLPP